MKKNILSALLALLSLTVSAQTEICNQYEELFYKCRNDSTMGFNGNLIIENHGGWRRESISIYGMDLGFEPKRDADGNVIEHELNPDTLTGADRFAYRHYAGSKEIMSRIEKILQSTRPGTDELYWWEKHQDGKDSMMVSLAYKNRYYSEAPVSFSHNGHTSYESAEVANYNYFSYDKRVLFDRLYSKGYFTLRYYCLLDSIATDLSSSSFDADAYKQSILHLLKDKHVEQRPVSWIHDEGYTQDCPNALDFYVSVTGITDSEGTWWAGNTTGTIYTLRAKKDGDEAAIRSIMEQFLDQTAQYVNAHPEQNYIYCPSIRIGDLLAAPKMIVKDTLSPNNFNVNVMAAHDDEGYHILLLRTKGVLWVPKHYSTLKSIYNDKEVFLKGKEPRKK